MSLTLRVLTGARAGHEQLVEKSIVVAGRHPMCDLRFDAERDRDVSTRHAELRAVGDVWMVRDLGSTNGTFLNGERIGVERVLSAGDTLSFGELGPRVQVAAASPHLAGATAVRQSPAPQREAGAKAPAPKAAPPKAAPPAGAPAARGPLRPRPSTGERVAQAVRESTRGLRWLAGATFALLVVVVAGAFWLTRRGDAERRAEIGALLRRNDSLSTAFEREMARVAGTMAGLDSALARARVEGDSLRARLERARSAEEIAAVTAQLERVQSERTRLTRVAQLDNTAIAAANGPAVAFLAVKMPDGTMFTGTAFAVTPQGLLVTNRHLVKDATSQEVAHELLVKFNGSRQWLPAHIVTLAETDDLALLQVEARGPLPIVTGVTSAAAPVGAPMVLMGFPLGMDTPQGGKDIDSFTASATLGTATVSKVLPDVLQLDTYASEGSSGSPVFDRDGRVSGVVYGGARASGGRIVYAVPAARLAQLLPPAARR
jgi:S1-C subfamily serine protease